MRTQSRRGVDHVEPVLAIRESPLPSLRSLAAAAPQGPMTYFEPQRLYFPAALSLAPWRRSGFITARRRYLEHEQPEKHDARNPDRGSCVLAFGLRKSGVAPVGSDSPRTRLPVDLPPPKKNLNDPLSVSDDMAPRSIGRADIQPRSCCSCVSRYANCTQDHPGAGDPSSMQDTSSERNTIVVPLQMGHRHFAAVLSEIYIRFHVGV